MQSHPRRITSTILALLALSTAALAGAASAGAQPIGNGGGTDLPQNPPPVADFTISPNPAFVTTQPVAQARLAIPGGAGAVAFPFDGGGQVVTFTASASDADGIASYAWDLDGDGSFETSGATARVEKKSYYRKGTFAIRLRVTDNAGQSTVVGHSLIVHAAPRAGLRADRPIGYVGQQFKLAPTGSTGDPSLQSFHWDMPGSHYPQITTSSAQIVPAEYTTAGPHTVTLTVTDTYGATATSSIVLQTENHGTTQFVQTPATAIINSPIHLDGSSSTADSPIVDYAWDLDGDGTYETDTHATPTVDTSYAHPGAHTVSLLTTDAVGLKAVDTHDIDVHVIQTVPVATLPTTGAVLLSTSAAVKGAAVAIRVGCAKAGATCKGVVTLRAAKVTVGSVAFKLAAGHTATMHVHLSKAARRVVLRRQTLAAQLSAPTKTGLRVANTTLTVRRAG